MSDIQPSTVRVAAVQAEGCYFDLEGAVEKTCRLITEAAEKGCDMIAFPEVWIPMYPGWIWQRPIDFEMVSEYMKHSLKRDSPEMRTIQNCALTNNIAVSLGYSENHNNSLYLSQSFIGKDGVIKMHRRKIKPTHAERTIYGDGSGSSLLNVVDEPGLGKVGALSCWEHSQPLLRYHTYSQGEQIHVAAWPPMNYYSSFPEGTALWSQCREGAHNLSTTHAIEGNCFVVLASSFYTQKGVDRMKLGDGKLYHIGGGGCACIIGPDGRKMTQDLGEEEEGLVIADLDFSEILKVKAMLDVHGHYSRPDLLWLGVDYREKKQVRPEVN
ncbi:carbon-nitrogen hydrolase [Aspergillus steynii IBT 23096]|uniref:nitrilase n=1 Tax=Aspergillus steynii IBT 23096 TaxID=1392250 RepID=A0A2I2GM56_9EURO|nr:carbon-nitrogen hydrolase [Aspergillus steynii IBT 23096]PLB53939.1 carbon-nitrogen hydrolase [Aspergillus steynii IBT 23096]